MFDSFPICEFRITAKSGTPCLCILLAWLVPEGLSCTLHVLGLFLPFCFAALHAFLLAVLPEFLLCVLFCLSVSEKLP